MVSRKSLKNHKDFTDCHILSPRSSCFKLKRLNFQDKWTFPSDLNEIVVHSHNFVLLCIQLRFEFVRKNFHVKCWCDGKYACCVQFVWVFKKIFLSHSPQPPRWKIHKKIHKSKFPFSYTEKNLNAPDCRRNGSEVRMTPEVHMIVSSFLQICCFHLYFSLFCPIPLPSQLNVSAGKQKQKAFDAPQHK